MKKGLLLLCTIAGLVLQSCTAGDKIPVPRYVEISCGMEKADTTKVTGSSAGGKMNFTWNEGDKITVVTKDGTKSSEFTLKSIDPSDKSKATFIGTLPGEGNNFNIFYKYDLNAGKASPAVPDIQAYQANGIANGTVPMSATDADVSKGFTLKVNDCSVFRFKITSEGNETVSHIVLVGYLADTAHIYTIDCGGKVTLSSSPTEFNIVANAGADWTGGFSLILTSTGDKVATKDKKGPVDISSKKGKVLGYPEFPAVFQDIPDAVQLYAGGPYWAKVNLGASGVGDYGDYYAWGEIQTKTDYSWSTYKYANGTAQSINKYNPTDTKTILESVDDAATQNLGKPWRMPTQQEMQRLKNECDWTVSMQGSTIGVTVSGKRLFEGKSIFLPASGHINGTDIYMIDEYCEYWCTLVDKNSTNYFCAWALHCGKESSAPTWSKEQRYLGKPIRPVCSVPGLEAR